MNALARNWWALVLRGVFAVIFGVMTWIWPALSVGVLVLLFGAYALADGIFSVIAGVSGHQDSRHWWMLLLRGGLGIAAGIFTFIAPAVTALALVTFIGVWAVLMGILEIVGAFRLRQQLPGEILMAVAGVLSVAWGVLLLVWPGPGALAVVWLIAAYAIGSGVLLIFLGFRLRGTLPTAGRTENRVPPAGASHLPA